MLFKSVLLAVAAAVAVSASAEAGFAVPDGVTEGTFTVYRNAAGEEVHEQVPASAMPTAPSAKFLRARAAIAPGQATCGAGGLNAGDTNKANAMLDAQCGNWKTVPSGRNVYSIYGGVVAYFCNAGAGTDGCGAAVRQQRSREITASCGEFKAGWSKVTATGLYGSVNSYGYESSSSKFCGCGKSC